MRCPRELNCMIGAKSKNCPRGQIALPQRVCCSRPPGLLRQDNTLISLKEWSAAILPPVRQGQWEWSARRAAGRSSANTHSVIVPASTRACKYTCQQAPGSVARSGSPSKACAGICSGVDEGRLGRLRPAAAAVAGGEGCVIAAPAAAQLGGGEAKTATNPPPDSTAGGQICLRTRISS